MSAHVRSRVDAAEANSARVGESPGPAQPRLGHRRRDLGLDRPAQLTLADAEDREVDRDHERLVPVLDRLGDQLAADAAIGNT